MEGKPEENGMKGELEKKWTNERKEKQKTRKGRGKKYREGERWREKSKTQEIERIIDTKIH